jgi:signal peptidase I
MTNPYAPPSPEASAPGAPARDRALAEPTRSDAPRWLAVLLAFFVGIYLLGLGQLILGRPRKAAVWLGIGLGLWAMLVVGVRLNVPSLTVVALPCLIVAYFGSLIGAGFLSAGRRLSSRAAVAAGVAVFGAGTAGAMAQRRFLTESYQSPSGAMMPTVLVGDHFFTAKGPRAEAGDVIVFKYPMNPEVDYVMRVIARGGDTIEVRDDVVFINGNQLPQTKLAEPCPRVPEELGGDQSRCVVLQEQNGSHRYRIQHIAGPTSYGPTTVPAGHLFFMGDSRHNSNDSRVWGTVPVAYVKAKAQFVWWSRLGSEYRWGRIGTRID